MEGEIKCGEGIFAEMEKRKNIITLTGKPMTEREFKMFARNLRKEGMSKANLDFIRKILYSDDKLKKYEKV